MNQAKRDQFKKTAHVVAALIFLSLAFYVFETPNIIIAFGLIGLGILFLIVAGVHNWLMMHQRNVSLIFLFLESAFLGAGAYIFAVKGYTIIYRSLLWAAIIFGATGMYFLLTKRTSKTKRHIHKRNDRTTQTFTM